MDMYPSTGGGGKKPEMPDASGKSMENDRQEDGMDSTLIPKAMCPGMKVGDKIEMEICHEYEDEFEVCMPKQGDKKENAEGMRESDGSQMKESMRGMDRMASFGGGE